ncbi:MAG TPA: c-type cytochrome domain-containing protein, partial [Verrucomicrobiae bacterium]|nr:c-type cytochrome domain-containing protein [Verrucomicrobiae bacterium]
MQSSAYKSSTVALLSLLVVLTGEVVAADLPGTNNASLVTVTAINSESAAIGFFKNKVLPIFKDNCYDCHSADGKVSGGLSLDDHAGLLKGGDTGLAIVAGDPEKSLLIQRLHAENPKQRMPKNSDPLTEDEVAVLKTWIKDGAVWSDDTSSAPVAHAGKTKIVDDALAAANTSKPGDQVEFFEKKIRPIFAAHCYNCHSADTKPAGGLRVDDLDGLITGGDQGPGIVPGNPDESLVLQRVLSQNPKRRMPKEGDLLTETEIADLAVWIKNGAAWPREQIPANIGKIRADYVSLRTNHWAWQPLAPAPVPAVSDNSWAHDDIDRFILAKLKTKELVPVADADRTTLI